MSLSLAIIDPIKLDQAEYIAVVDNDRFVTTYLNIITLWNFENEIIRTFEVPSRFVESIAVSPKGNRIASLSLFNNTVCIWDTDSGDCIRTISFEGMYERNCFTFSPCGNFIAIGIYAHDIMVKFFNIDSGMCVQTLKSKSRLYSIAYGTTYFVITDHANINVYLTEYLVYIGKIKVRGSVAITYNEKIVSRSDDGIVRVWHIEGRNHCLFKAECIQVFDMKTHNLVYASLSPNNQLYISGPKHLCKNNRVWKISDVYLDNDNNFVTMTPDKRHVVYKDLKEHNVFVCSVKCISTTIDIPIEKGDLSDELFRKTLYSPLFYKYIRNCDKRCIIQDIIIQSVDDIGYIKMFVHMTLNGDDISGPVILHKPTDVVLPILRCNGNTRYVLLIKSPHVATSGYILECPKYPFNICGIDLTGTVTNYYGEYYPSPDILNETVRLFSFETDISEAELDHLDGSRYGNMGTVQIVNFDYVLDIMGPIDMKAMMLYQWAVNDGSQY